MNALMIFLSAMLIAIATVIFIHLFFKRVSRTVPFTYTWLLKRTLQQIRRRRRLQHLLILLLRTGAITLVTLAILLFFYKPDSTNVPTVVIIDNSASMNRGDPPLLWQAIKWIEDNVDNFLYAITCDDIIKDKNQLANIETYYGFCSLDKQLALMQNLRDTVVTFVISDFQRGYYADIIHRSFTPIVLEGPTDNVWIDSIWLAGNSIVVKWINTSLRETSIQLKINDKVKSVKKWHSEDSIQYDTMLIRAEGTMNTIHISISGDPVYFDNEFFAVLGSQPTKVFLQLSDTLFNIAHVIAQDTMFKIVSEPVDADVIISGFIEDLPMSVKRSLLSMPKPKIFFYKTSGTTNQIWLNRRNPFWKEVLQDYGRAPIPLPISSSCPQNPLTGTPLLFTDSCVIASIENQTLHAVYNPTNKSLVSHPIYVAMIYKVLLGPRAYELHYLRNDDKTISLFSKQEVKFLPIKENLDEAVSSVPMQPGFYYIISNRDTQLVGINLPKGESILTIDIPKTPISQQEPKSRIVSFAPYLLLSFALILLLIESLVLRKRKDYEENAS